MTGHWRIRVLWWVYMELCESQANSWQVPVSSPGSGEDPKGWRDKQGPCEKRFPECGAHSHLLIHAGGGNNERSCHQLLQIPGLCDCGRSQGRGNNHWSIWREEKQCDWIRIVQSHRWAEFFIRMICAKCLVGPGWLGGEQAGRQGELPSSINRQFYHVDWFFSCSLRVGWLRRLCIKFHELLCNMDW